MVPPVADPRALEERLGHAFRDPALRDTALTHTSWVNEARGRDQGQQDNERLEFLGDAVLALCASDVLMRRFPDRPEGDLSRARAALVSAGPLARLGEALGLGAHLRLGRGEEQAGGRSKTSILADALEALLGAVYLDGGFAAAFAVAARLLDPQIDAAVKEGGGDHKSRLQELTQARAGAAPEYVVVGTAGPDHARVFEVEIRLSGKALARASGRSKKEAEQAAAALALAALEGAAPARAP